MIVIHDVSNEPPLKGDLFAGLQFWISQRCPNRNDLVNRVKYNGGAVVFNEKHAKYLIVDQERDNPPPGAISYRFILDSVANERLEDVENHRCGRPVGSAKIAGSARRPRHGRVPFSAQDDIDIYRYVRRCKRQGCAVRGNEIYKEFAKENPRHSSQSWRDRYVKYLSEKPPVGASNLTPSPEPRPVEFSAKSNGQNTATVTSTEPSNKSTDGASEPKTSSEPRSSESPANGNGEKDTSFSSKRLSNSGPRLKKISFGGSPCAIDKLCPDLPALVDQFRLADFHSLAGAGDTIGNSEKHNDEAWARLASKDGNHTAEQWRTFWEKCICPVYQQVGNDETKRQIYDEALEGWETEFGADASIRKWVSHFREEVAPKLRDPSLASNQESTNGRPPEQQQVSKLDNDSTDRYHGENSRSASPKPKPEGGSWNLDGSKSSPVQSSQGKRPRENDSDDEDRIETPPTKRPRLISPFDEPEGEIHDSIEFSPTKKLASSPLGERKVIQVGSERSSSSPSDLYVWNDREQRGPGVKEAPKAEQALNETQETEDQSSQEKVERVRQIFQGLDEKIVVELLDLLRTAPLAPQEPDGVTPYDAAAIRTFHVFKNRDMAADWQQFNEIFATKLEKLGILGQLSQDGDEDSEEDEDGEGQGEQHNDEQDGQDEHHDGQQDEHQEEQYEQQYEQQHEHPGESEAPKIGPANGDIHHEHEHEPTVFPESPLRSATSQVNNSNDTTFTFVDSATQIDDDDSPSESPIDLTTEEEAQAYITSRLNPPWAFSEAEILIALHATCSNSTVFADRVLRWMRQNDPTKGKGKGKERSRGRRSSIGPGDKLLPVIPGVWTGDDDEAVLGLADHEEEQRIARKHGPSRCRQRRAFLKSFE